MVGCAPSTSGRSMEAHSTGGRSHNLSGHALVLPSRRDSRRSAHRAVTCRAIALPNKLQNRLLKALQHLFRTSQTQPAETMFVEVSPNEASGEHEEKAQPHSLLKQATYAAINVGLKLTGIAIRLAKTVVDDVKRSVRFLQVRQEVQRKAAAIRLGMNEETLREFDAHREMLRQQGRDAGFMKMLQVLDRSHMDHEAKWALVQKHTADKADFSERLQLLYKAASDSKEAVETLLRPDASRAEINQFWRSEQTAALIAEEESLKQLVFAQMLQGSAA